MTSGTIFDSTKLPLTRWFLAMQLLIQSKNNVSALELRRQIRVCYRTAWLVKTLPDEPWHACRFVGGHGAQPSLKDRATCKSCRPRGVGIVPRIPANNESAPVNRWRSQSFFASRRRGEVPMRTVFWRDMLGEGTTANVLATFAALMVASQGASLRIAAASHFTPLP